MLQRLNVQDNKIASKGLVALCRVLKSNRTLTSINLTRNPMDAMALAALLDALQGKFPLEPVM